MEHQKINRLEIAKHKVEINIRNIMVKPKNVDSQVVAQAAVAMTAGLQTELAAEVTPLLEPSLVSGGGASVLSSESEHGVISSCGIPESVRRKVDSETS